MLKEILPKIADVAVLWTTVHPSQPYELKSIGDAARRLGMVVTTPVWGCKEIGRSPCLRAADQ